jgi:cadmium resistance protein CadD (predicted permease)
MSHLSGLFAATVATFAATNLDDLFLLTLLFARGVPTRRIATGQYLGFGTIIALSCLAVVLTFAVPAHWIRWLGLLPLGIGVRGLVKLRRPGGTEAPLVQPQSTLAIASITLSNGADNVGVYLPFFRLNSQKLWLILIVYAALVGVWCFAGRLLGRHPLVLQIIQRVGHWLVPVVFIGLGLSVLTS